MRLLNVMFIIKRDNNIDDYFSKRHNLIMCIPLHNFKHVTKIIVFDIVLFFIVR